MQILSKSHCTRILLSRPDTLRYSQETLRSGARASLLGRETHGTRFRNEEDLASRRCSSAHCCGCARCRADGLQHHGGGEGLAGGVVPGATVTALSHSTDRPPSRGTDAGGFFTRRTRRPVCHDVSAEPLLQEGQPLWCTRRGGRISSSPARRPVPISETVTVTAEATPLQTDATRKTVEAKDIESLLFSGRNPIGVARRSRPASSAATSTTPASRA